jgi:DNA-binding MarR family transcriptional regulator
MVRLTAAGRKAIKGAAPRHVESVQRYIFDLLSEEELETLASVFDRVLANVTREMAKDSRDR